VLLYTEAAAAVRRRDCTGAFKTLAPLLSPRGPETDLARLLTGFYAHSCEQVGLAEERLFAAQAPSGPLEDWRLFLLSDAARARGHVLLAQASLARLIGDYPASPLRPRAMSQAARAAWEGGDAQQALDLVAQARRERLAGSEAADLEALAWEIGNKTANEEVRRDAARRLLAGWPAKATELQVAEIFRQPDGTLVWSSVLGAEQLEQRARSLLDLKLDPDALEAVDSVAPGDRDLDWALLEAETLTRLHRGADALSLLSLRASDVPRQSAALEWARARAAGDVATAWRGRQNLASAERQAMGREAQQHLRRVIQIGVDHDLTVKALKALYADLADEDRFDESMDILRQLRKVAPEDTSGANNLWAKGWNEYGRRNYSGAVGYWTELYALFPNDASGRRGRYWTARAFDALGEDERAQQIYAEVAAADTTDFYRKNALGRLQRRPSAPPEPAPEAWPTDPLLSRARLLTDLGLEGLAATELALVREHANERAARALEAMILARQGDRRKSVLAIRDAFPLLGGPFQAALPEEARRLYYPVDYQDTIRTWAANNRLPPYLVMGIIRQESAFDTNAQSWAGARGLMQLMPNTARELAGKAGLLYSHDKLSDPSFNVRLGTTYFSQVMNMFDNNVDLALAGYNGGPYRVKRLWKESGSRELDKFLEGLGLEESKTYVKRILVLSDSYRQLYPLPG
jgi:soluble lytic murein transglycosylase-like protein